ncbi:MAG: DUF2070 family protein [Candidatus Hodarchaeota archaeon]
MGEKAKVKETVRLYSRVWQLPTFRGIILRIVLAILLAAFASSVMRALMQSSLIFLEVLLFSLLTLGIPSVLGTLLLYLIIRKEGSPLDARRTAGSVQFGIFFWMGFGTVGSLLDLLLASQFYEVRFWILGLGIAYLFFSFLVTGLSDHHPARNFIAALMIPILWYSCMVLFSGFSAAILTLPQLWLLSAVVIMLSFTFTVHYIFRAVSVPFERDLGINGPELLRAFGYDYLTDNPEPIETTLTKIGVKEDIPMEIMVFKNGEELVAVGVIEYVHPGPFRQIGSSSLPSVIIDHIKTKYNVPAFVMHASCTHQQNLTTKADFPIILEEIDRLIHETQVHSTISGPHWNDLGKFKVWTIFAGEDVLTISTSAPEFTDDISLEVGRDAAKMVRERVPSIGGVAIVDAHNCINDDAVSVMPGDPDASEYVGSISSAVFSTINEKRKKVSAGFYQVIPDNIDAKEGIGPGGVTAAVLKREEHEFVIVSIDGNNMQPGFREQAISLLKTQGFDDAEIVTTDTHVVNAISLSSRGYPPVGQNKAEETLDSIVIVANKARETLQEVQVGIGFGEAKDLRTFGERGFDVLTQDIVESASIAKRAGILSGAIAFLISVIFAFFV